jgi:pimeloyl-ACP methyl ester carboxylesterase
MLLGLVIVLWLKSPGTTDPIVDTNGKMMPNSIATIAKVTLGNVEQTLIIRGADRTKPVMLFLHGGPGSPELIFLRNTNSAIENDFVMVYWEQRGAGKSYSEEIPVESMNLEQFISDTKDLSELLAKRFGKDKIHIMGHSWGSLLAILTAHQYPELFYAYFGIGQVCHQYKGEQISTEWVKQQAQKRKNKGAIEALSAMSFPDSLANSDAWWDYLAVERKYVMQFGGGVTHEMRGMWPLVKMILEAEEYTFGEKMDYLKASTFSIKHLWPDVIDTNLFHEIDSMQVPVYILQGVHDYQTPYSLAKDFYDQLKAPQKAFFTFENSAHSPLMEEHERFNSIIREKAMENE